MMSYNDQMMMVIISYKLSTRKNQASDSADGWVCPAKNKKSLRDGPYATCIETQGLPQVCDL